MLVDIFKFVWNPYDKQLSDIGQINYVLFPLGDGTEQISYDTSIELKWTH